MHNQIMGEWVEDKIGREGRRMEVDEGVPHPPHIPIEDGIVIVFPVSRQRSAEVEEQLIQRQHNYQQVDDKRSYVRQGAPGRRGKFAHSQPCKLGCFLFTGTLYESRRGEVMVKGKRLCKTALFHQRKTDRIGVAERLIVIAAQDLAGSKLQLSI